jgi:metal-responsive CopG/Arc/MetJ family transcriptional regulator
MTSTTISVKLPARLLEEIPAAGNGRSAFIIKAIEEKLARRKSEEWQPKTARGARMASLLKKGKRERLPLLSEAEVERELAVRRGRNF